MTKTGHGKPPSKKLPAPSSALPPKPSTEIVRVLSVLLDRIDGVAMNDEAKNHWKGIARFFRALQYYRMVQTFGNVPWYSHALEIADSAAIYKQRDPRKLVMDSVLVDITFAVNNIRQTDLANTVNKDVALALKARIPGRYPMVVALAHDELGYILDPEDFDKDLYKYEKSMSVGKETWPRLFQAAQELLGSGAPAK